MASLCSANLSCVDGLFADLCVDSEVPRLPGLPDPLQFYRDFVSPNRPCVIEAGCASWPALRRWTNEYLKRIDAQVTVAATPDGWADAIRGEHFCLPHETKLSLANVIDALEKPRSDEILYIQKQNSNLEDEFSALWDDIGPDLREWGSQVFGAEPDASNFWMGDHRAITSMHKDHYENLYAVVRGFKTFTLCPPHAVLRIPHRLCKNAVHRRHDYNDDRPPSETTGDGCSGVGDEIPPCRYSLVPTQKRQWTLEPTEGETLWVDGRPEEWPGVQCIKVVVKMGDVLFLPSLWFHQVQQSHQCIAVNFWFDMKYDQRYCYFKMAELLNPTIAEHSRQHLSETSLTHEYEDSPTESNSQSAE